MSSVALLLAPNRIATPLLPREVIATVIGLVIARRFFPGRRSCDRSPQWVGLSLLSAFSVRLARSE